MTSLGLPQSRLEVSDKQVCDAVSLRAWLAGRWAILFSHPDDFAQEQLEADRWLSILSRSFDGRGVAPVALARAGRDPEQGWLGRLAALDYWSAAILALEPLQPGAVADFSASALRAHVACYGPRFALIVDSNLRCRRALSYRLPDELPSPLDLIGWAVTLRKRDHATGSREEMPESSFPIRSGSAMNPRCAFAPGAHG